MLRLIPLLFGLAAVPAAAQAPEQGGESIVATGWSLKTDGDKEREAAAPAAPRHKARPSRNAKPRLIGRARVSNSKYRSRKGSASVGVAVPF